MGMMSVLDVANFFLSKSIPNTQQAVTHLKLQKLVYYAQAFYLAFDCETQYKDNLFDDKLQAWTHGPVSRQVYDTFQEHGNRFEELPVFYGDVPSPDDYIKQILECVWKTYGNFSGSQLEFFTHRETPWISARMRAGVEPWEPSNEIIDLKEMKNYYKKSLGLLQ